MKPTNTSSGLQAKNILRIIIGTLFVLAVPLIAMQFIDEVKWDFKDFMLIGSLLIGTGFLYEFIASKVSSPIQRVILAVVMLLVVSTIWVELAVGIFD